MSRPQPPQGTRRLLELVEPATGAAVGLGAHQARYGPLVLRGYGGPHGPTPLADVVERSGLSGRGGAGFPLAVKLREVARQPRGPAVVVANGSEGEPASAKDRTLLTRVPHLVLDGAVLAADALGADSVVVCVGAGGVAAVVAAAVAERERRGHDPVAIEVRQVPAGYVSGQESALVSWLSGGRPLPTVTPPRPAERGVRGRPTLVSNVETLAQLALLTRFGDRWFAEVGTAAHPGTVLLTVGGSVHRPGVYEVAFGTRIAAVLETAGSIDPQAVLVGGYFGGWLALPTGAEVPLAPDSLRAAGTDLGAGVLLALSRQHCGLAQTAAIVRWMAAESAGQCGPCLNGLPTIAGVLTGLASATPGGQQQTGEDRLGGLEHWLTRVEGRGACRHPDGVARLVRSAVRTFDEDLLRHVRGRSCPAAPERSAAAEPDAAADRWSA